MLDNSGLSDASPTFRSLKHADSYSCRCIVGTALVSVAYSSALKVHQSIPLMLISFKSLPLYYSMSDLFLKVG